MTESNIVGDRPSAGPELSTLYRRPLAVDTQPEASGVVEAGGTGAEIVGEAMAVGVSVSGTLPVLSVVWQLAKTRAALSDPKRMREKEQDFME